MQVIFAVQRINAKKFRGDDELFKFVWEHVVHFPPASPLKQCHLAIIIFSCRISIARSVGQSHVLYRSLSMERGAVLTATQWPSPLEVRALPHLKLRAFPTDMSECTGRCVECVSQTLELVAPGCQFRA